MGLGQGSLAFGVGFRVSAVVFVVCCLASQFSGHLLTNSSRTLQDCLMRLCLLEREFTNPEFMGFKAWVSGGLA